ncbi:MAG: hypothetical protein ABW185_07645 [Sedimenticola sp.]
MSRNSILDELRESYLGACPRIGHLLRKAHFGPFCRSFSLNKSNYSPQMTRKNDSKWTSLATAPILGQAPSRDLLSNAAKE